MPPVDLTPLADAFAVPLGALQIVSLVFLTLVALFAILTLLPGPVGKRAYKTLRILMRMKIPPGGG
ncbi:hypothetical protein BWO91_14310 [Plantibacter flavus]|nr:hypothetical protein BWO91_14310 [Plantibacter flavus]